MKKFKCFVLFGIALLLALVSCGNSDSSNDSSIVEDTYYTVFFDTAGGSTIDSQSVKEGDRVKRPNKPVRNGYTFSGWLNEGESYSFLESVYSDITLTASWIAMANQLTLSTNLEGASTLIGSGRYETDEDVTIESKTNPGYEFLGWYFGDSLISNKEIYNFKMLPESVNYEARYIKSTNVQYKVKHYKTSFAYETELVETEVFYGTTGTILNTSDYVKEYDNYHWFETTSSYPLNGDGTTVVEVYYVLDTYNLKLNTNNSQYGVTKLNGSTYKSATIEYGTNNTIEAVPNPGYTFVGWYDESGLVSEDSKYTFTMPANDLVYEARFAPSTNTLYKVEHYLQNANDDNYVLTDIDNLAGTTGEYTNSELNEYKGFIAPTIHQSIINGDGSTVVKYYYDRAEYKVTRINYFNGTPYEQEILVRYNDTFEIDYGMYLGRDVSQVFINGEFIDLLDLPQKLTITNDAIIDIFYVTKEEMELFNFTSTKTTLNITGIKDKTVTEIVVPDYVTSIGNSAFSGCTNLANIMIPNSVTSIGNSAFSGCTNLANIMIPNSVTSIGDYSFSGCTNLANIMIPNSVTSIGDYSFSRCTNLANITIPNSVKTIDSYAFNECNNLTNVYYNGTITNWLNIYFNGDYSNPMQKATNFYMLDKNGQLEYQGSKYYLVEELIIPTTIETIGSYKFSGFEQLKFIYIPRSVTRIGWRAFSGCSSLTSITIPDSVTQIGNGAFYECSGLESITLPFIGQGVAFDTYLGYVFGATRYQDNSSFVPKSLKNVTVLWTGGAIRAWAFYKCSNLINITLLGHWYNIGEGSFYGCSSLGSIILSENVTSIEQSAFNGCSSLRSIVISKNIKNIFAYAFSRCESLEKIYFSGSVEEWNTMLKNIVLHVGNEKFLDATKYYYSETEPTDEGNYWHYVDGVATEW